MSDRYLNAWHLVVDGEPMITRSSRLLPVRMDGQAAMLKITDDPQERIGGRLMAWWDGDGAARVLARRENAILLERAEGIGSLAAMARGGEDDGACRVLCTVAARLHGARPTPHPDLTPLAGRFDALTSAAAAQGGILGRCDAAARALLCRPRDAAILHGDLHHGNVLDFGARGWLAIDPKGLTGETGFDYANIFCNPDLSDATVPVATRPEVFAARLVTVTKAAGLERGRLLTWILAWAGLSAAWIIQSDTSPATSLRVARLAAAELDR